MLNSSAQTRRGARCGMCTWHDWRQSVPAKLTFTHLVLSSDSQLSSECSSPYPALTVSTNMPFGGPKYYLHSIQCLCMCTSVSLHLRTIRPAAQLLFTLSIASSFAHISHSPSYVSCSFGLSHFSTVSQYALNHISQPFMPLPTFFAHLMHCVDFYNLFQFSL